MSEHSFWNDKKDKKWWGNFWYYYKTPILWGIVVLFVLTLGIRQCNSNVESDLTTCYIGDLYFATEAVNAIQTAFTPFVQDADGKDGVSVYFKQITAGSQNQGEAVQMSQMTMLEVAAGDTYLYLMSKPVLDQLSAMELFDDISPLLGTAQPTYGVSIQGSKLLAQATGLTNEPLYAGVRVMTTANAKKQQEQIKHQNATTVLLELLKH